MLSKFVNACQTDQLDNTVKFTAAGLSMVAVTYGLARYCFGLFLPEIRDEFALSEAMLGIIAGASYGGYLVATIIGSWLSTLLGARIPILVGGIAATAGMTVIGTASGPEMLLVGVVIAGASPGLAYPPYSDVIVKCVPGERQNTTYGWINSGTGFGVALAGPLALWAGGDWRTVWFVFAALAIVSTIWNCSIIPSTRGSSVLENEAAAGYLRTLARWSAAPHFLAAFLFGIVTAIYWTYAVDLLFNLTGDRQDTILFWVTLGIAGILGCFAGKIADILGLRWAYWTVLPVVALAIMSLPLVAHSVFGILLSAVLFGSGFIVATALFGMWSMRIFRATPSIGFGATFFLISLGQGIGPIFGGFVIPVIGQAYLFLCAGMLCMIISAIPPVKDNNKQPIK